MSRAATVLGRLDVPALPHQVSVVRRWLSALLSDYASVCDDVVLLASETVTNAIRHSDSAKRNDDGEPGKVTIVVLDSNGTIRVETIDAGSPTTTPRVADYGSDAPDGRGLRMLDTLSNGRWGTCADGVGRTVWFEISNPQCDFPEA